MFKYMMQIHFCPITLKDPNYIHDSLLLGSLFEHLTTSRAFQIRTRRRFKVS